MVDIGLLLNFRAECDQDVEHFSQEFSQKLNFLFERRKMGEDVVEFAKCLFSVNTNTYDEFLRTIEQHDFNYHRRCRIVLIPESIRTRYTCWTCSKIEGQGVLLCTDCFEAGSHVSEGHIFEETEIVKDSKCSCGDTNVMVESGCCGEHSEANSKLRSVIPASLIKSTRHVLLRLVSKLLYDLRVTVGCNAAQTGPIFALLLEIGKRNSVIQQMVIDVMCDASWYDAVLWNPAQEAEQSASGVALACAMGNAKIREGNCLQFRKLVAAAFTFPNACSKCQLYLDVQFNSVVDELVFWFWFVRFDLPESAMKFVQHYSSDSSNTFAWAFARASAVQYPLWAQLCMGYVTRRTRQTAADDGGSAKAGNATATSSEEQLSEIQKQMALNQKDAAAKMQQSLQKLVFGAEKTVVRLANEQQLLERLLCAIELVFEQRYMLKKCLLRTSDAQSPCSAQVIDLRTSLRSKLGTVAAGLRQSMQHKSVAAMFARRDDLLKQLIELAMRVQGMDAHWLSPTANAQKHRLESGFNFERQITAIMGFVVSYTQCLEVGNSVTMVQQYDRLRSVIVILQDKLTEWLDSIGARCKLKQFQFDEALCNPVSLHIPVHRMLAICIGAHFAFANAVRRELTRLVDLQTSSKETQSREETLMKLTMLFERSCEMPLSETVSYCAMQHAMVTVSALARFRMQATLRNELLDEYLVFAKETVHQDLFLLQLCAEKVDPDVFLQSAMGHFLVRDLTLLASDSNELQTRCMLESLLVTVSMLLCQFCYWYVDLSYAEQVAFFRRQLVALMSIGDQINNSLFSGVPFGIAVSQDAAARANDALRGAWMQPSRTTYALTQEVWRNEYNPANTFMYSTSRSLYLQSLQRYLDNAATQQDKLELSQRGVTIDSIWPPIRMPSLLRFNLAPDAIRADSLLRCSSFYGLLFVVLHRACSSEVARFSRNSHALPFAVHLINVAINFHVSNNEDRVLTSQSITKSDVVRDAELHNWYPASVCKDAFACLTHVIGTVVASASSKHLLVEESLLSLLLKHYKTFSRYDYNYMSGGRNSFMFRTGSDAIGSLLDFAFARSRLVSAAVESLRKRTDPVPSCSTSTSVDNETFNNANQPVMQPEVLVEQTVEKPAPEREPSRPKITLSGLKMVPKSKANPM